MEVGDQVLVAGQKHGIVRFYGKTDFAPGLSAGLQLIHWELNILVSNNICIISKYIYTKFQT